MADHELNEGDAKDTAGVRSGAHSIRQEEPNQHNSISMDITMRIPSLFGAIQPTNMSNSIASLDHALKQNLSAQIRIDLGNFTKQINDAISRPKALGFALGPSFQNQMIEQLRTSQSRLLEQIIADAEKSISPSLKFTPQIGKMLAFDKTWAEVRLSSHAMRALDGLALQNRRVIQMHSAEVLRRTLTDLQRLSLAGRPLDLIEDVENKHANDHTGRQLDRDQDSVRLNSPSDMHDATELSPVEISSHSVQPFQRIALLWIISEIASRMIVDQLGTELIEVLAAYVRLLVQLAFENNVIQSDILSSTTTESLLVKAEVSTLLVTD